MRWITTTLLLLGSPWIAAGGDDQPSDALKALRGTWTVESQRSDPGARPKASLEYERVVVEKNKWVRKGGHKDGGEARIEWNPTATALAIDVIDFERVTGKELRYLGIYRLEGDTLTVVTNLGGTSVPNALRLGRTCISP